VCTVLAQQLGRVPTVKEVATVYDPLRDHPSDALRVRNIAKAIRACAKTFDASAASGKGESWEAARDELLQAVRRCVTPVTYEQAGHPKWIGKIKEAELAVALFHLTLNSFARQRDPDWQWTFGYDSIQAMFRQLCGHGVKRAKIPVIQRLLVTSGLAECFDPEYQIATESRKGIAKKYHVGKNHPRYAAFLRHCETHAIHVRWVADSRT
jgi:hypothetical protein